MHVYPLFTGNPYSDHDASWLHLMSLFLLSKSYPELCRSCHYLCRAVICIRMWHMRGASAQALSQYLPCVLCIAVCTASVLAAVWLPRFRGFFSRNMGERRFHLLQCPAATYNFTPINQCHLHAGNVTFALLNECLNKTLSCDEVRFASEIL